MSDDLKDWLKFKFNVSKDKKVEKFKQGIKSLPPEKKISRTTEIPPLKMYSSRTNLVREIVLNDQACVERSIIKKLRTGTLPINMSIDLHGYTIDQAHRIFYKSFCNAVSQGLRLMLVITGKGNRNEASIRNQLMNWVNLPEISSNIIYITHAIQSHGGEGAFYIVLRRNGGSGRS